MCLDLIKSFQTGEVTAVEVRLLGKTMGPQNGGQSVVESLQVVEGEAEGRKHVPEKR